MTLRTKANKTILLIWPIALCILIIIIIAATGLNRNILYISMLLSGTTPLLLLTNCHTLRLLIVGFFCFFLFPTGIPKLAMLNIANPQFQTLQLGTEYKFTFELSKIENYRLSFGQLMPKIIIDGKNLENLAFTVQGGEINAHTIVSKYHFQQLTINLNELHGQQPIAISLHTQNVNEPFPEILQGTEANSLDLYPDAVWLRITAPGKPYIIVYHAKRQEIPITEIDNKPEP